MDTPRPVRPSEQLDWPRLADYLRDVADRAIPELDSAAEIQVEQFPGGHSNLTYLVRWGCVELVLRRPPFGPVAPRAHDMAREYRWLQALHPVFPLAPCPYLLCEDTNIVGSTFYLMERRRGIIVRQEEPPALAGDPQSRGRVSGALIDALVDLHAIEIDRAGLSHLGKPAGFVERQVRGWTDRWHRAQTHERPELDRVARWLLDHLPAPPDRPTVVHGDFKLDNVILDETDVGRIVAVLDWEMTALGDPLVDLGILLAYWTSTGGAATVDAVDPGTGVSSVTEGPGWFTRDAILHHYATRSSRDLAGVQFYEILALFKVAVVVQQIFFRYMRGQTDDPRFGTFDRRVASLAHRAAALIDGPRQGGRVNS